MPRYRFITRNGGDHAVEIECPNDKAARIEARKAFAEAAHDALVDSDQIEMTMTVDEGGRVIFRGLFSFAAMDVN
ncbi:hypothetical protein AB4Z10_15660 [Bosea sp. RAF48]|uniref:DUF6894 family protein n=1 Tax=Bosea sp. RAF48 TaxID=3237480 RepID=UPI003F925BD8